MQHGAVPRTAETNNPPRPRRDEDDMVGHFGGRKGKERQRRQEWEERETIEGTTAPASVEVRRQLQSVWQGEPSVEKLLAQTTRQKVKEKKARARKCPALKEESKTNPKRASKHDRLDHDRRRMDAGSDRFADDER